MIPSFLYKLHCFIMKANIFIFFLFYYDDYSKLFSIKDYILCKIGLIKDSFNQEKINHSIFY